MYHHIKIADDITNVKIEKQIREECLHVKPGTIVTIEMDVLPQGFDIECFGRLPIRTRASDVRLELLCERDLNETACEQIADADSVYISAL